MTNSEKYFIVVDRKVEIDTAVKSFKEYTCCKFLDCLDPEEQGSKLIQISGNYLQIKQLHISEKLNKNVIFYMLQMEMVVLDLRLKVIYTEESVTLL